MDLCGPWRVAASTEDLRRSFTDESFDDSGWEPAVVPGHWRSVPTLGDSDGPVLYRKRFATRSPGPSRRCFLVFDGLFYQGSVWMDGQYLGDTEGYFYPHSFEISQLLANGDEHLLALEVSCAPPTDWTAKRNVTGVFQHSPYIDPAWNPGGIWGRVHIDETGPLRIVSLKVLCQEANSDRATLDLEVEVDSVTPLRATLRTQVARAVLPPLPTAREQSADSGPLSAATPAGAALRHSEHNLSAGMNRLRWTVAVESPDLWWPKALGNQPLYGVEVDAAVTDGIPPLDGPTPPDHSPPADSSSVSDRRQVVTGLRQTRLRSFVTTLNGERMYLKGVNCAPTRRDIATATPAEVVRDVRLASEAGFDLMRLDGHIARPEFYAEADRLGMLIWQDLPLKWGYAAIRRRAALEARRAVRILGHHPSIVAWCAHNEAFRVDSAPSDFQRRQTPLRVAATSVRPDWDAALLDRTLRRALESEDGTRAVISRSGALPHPGGATDSHLFFGWSYGDAAGLASLISRLPIAGRFVGAFGAQSVPDSADFMNPRSWPDLDWDGLAAHFGMDTQTFQERLPPSHFATFDEWRAASQRLQANLLRYQIETLRRLKYRPSGGFCVSMLADAQPAVSFSLFDHNRLPKSAYRAVRAACAPLIVCADRLSATYSPGDRVSLSVHAVNDMRRPVERATVEAVIRYPGGERHWRFEGDVPADSCVLIAKPSFALPDSAATGRLVVELALGWAGGRASNRYLASVVM